MKSILRKTGNGWLQAAVNNPKKFFAWSMILLSVSLIFSLIQGIFFPAETVFKIRPPNFYSENHTEENSLFRNNTEIEKVVRELNLLKDKRDQKALDQNDSLRIDYLFDQYQKLKNGR